MNKLSKPKKPALPDKIYLHHIEPEIPIDGFEFYQANKISKIKNNSLKEIIVQDIFEFHNDENNLTIINELYKKLAPNGKLHIQCLDLKSLCHNSVYSQIDDKTFKTLIFAGGKCNIYSLSQMKELIRSVSGLSISKIKFINGLQYYIECIKLS